MRGSSLGEWFLSRRDTTILARHEYLFSVTVCGPKGQDNCRGKKYPKPLLTERHSAPGSARTVGPALVFHRGYVLHHSAASKQAKRPENRRQTLLPIRPASSSVLQTFYVPDEGDKRHAPRYFQRS